MSDLDFRSTQRRDFLLGAGWGRARLAALTADASFRRYFRLTEAHRRAMLMDAPPPREDIRPWMRIARLLHRLDYSAPHILASDAEAGFLLLEDLGDATFTRRLAAGADEMSLYRLATDLLIDLHRRYEPDPAFPIPPYDDDLLLTEARLFTDWFLPAATGCDTDDDLTRTYLDLWRGVLAKARTVPDCLVLRDYHVDNLMDLDDRPGLTACGLLDFQDAVYGPQTYDLVSLLEDARRDVSAPVVAALRARYLAAFPAIDPDHFAGSMAILGAQRHAKVLGIFVRLMRRDGKPVYLNHLPRLWRLLAHDLTHPLLAPLRAWFDRHVPPELRGIPTRLTPQSQAGKA